MSTSKRSSGPRQRHVTGPVTLAFVLAVGGVLGASPAAAGPSDNPSVIYNDALELESDGKWDEAIVKYEKIFSEGDLNVKYHLAVCYEQKKQVTRAWALFTDVAETGTGDMNRKAAPHLKSLEKSPMLAIELPSSITTLAGLVVQVDGVRVPLRGPATHVPVEPGRYDIAVMATGKQAWSHKGYIDIAGKTIVGPSMLQDAASPRPPEPRVSIIRPSIPVKPPPSPVPPEWPKQRTGALVAGGLGLIALSVGTVFGVLELVEDKKVSDPPPGSDAKDILRTRGEYAAVANVSIATGIGLSAAAVILGLTAPRARADAGAAGFAPVVTGGGGGVVYHGSF